MEIFTKLGGIVLSRWFHVLAGVTWIGLLYYFNFVQTPALAGFEAGSRTEVQAKLLPRALWWFRWGAALTLLTGIMILGFQEQFKASYFKTPSGASIITVVMTNSGASRETRRERYASGSSTTSVCTRWRCGRRLSAMPLSSLRST